MTENSNYERGVTIRVLEKTSLEKRESEDSDSTDTDSETEYRFLRTNSRRKSAISKSIPHIIIDEAPSSNDEIHHSKKFVRVKLHIEFQRNRWLCSEFRQLAKLGSDLATPDHLGEVVRHQSSVSRTSSGICEPARTISTLTTKYYPKRFKQYGRSGSQCHQKVIVNPSKNSEPLTYTLIPDSLEKVPLVQSGEADVFHYDDIDKIDSRGLNVILNRLRYLEETVNSMRQEQITMHREMRSLRRRHALGSSRSATR